MIILVVSDFHLGKGKFLKNGQLNILEDFFEDNRFQEFTEFYSTGKNYWTDIHLVLNGDILNLIQIDYEGVFSHVIDEEMTLKQLDRIVEGHGPFFDGLREFLKAPNKRVTYVIGNHDTGIAFQRVQERFCHHVGKKIDFLYELEVHGTYIEHGHRFETINYVTPEKTFVPGPNGKTILNLPWGTLFCTLVLPQLKKDRPFIDRIRPLSSYVKWTLFHDPTFFFKMGFTVFKYFLLSRFDTYMKQNRNFKTTIRILKQITIYPKYEKMAKRILKKRPNIHTVIMGHTHLLEWRKFPGGKYYFNSGTWNTIPTIDAALHESVSHLTYILVDVHEKTDTVREASMNVWQGKWRPFVEEVTLSG